MQNLIARLCTALIFTALLSISSLVHAKDKYGQTVSAALEADVNLARELRLPYKKTTYDQKRSIRILEKVVKQKPDYYRAWFNLALAYHQDENYRKSLTAFDKAFKIRAKQKIKDDTILNTAGWVSLKNEDFRRAEKHLKQAEARVKGKNNSTEKSVYGNLGEVYFLTQRFDLSKKYFTLQHDKFNSDSAARYLKILNKTNKRIRAYKK